MTALDSLERRDIYERRTSIQATQFPIITLLGVCVRYDRRRQPDRRVALIEVDERKLQKDTFDFIFLDIRTS